MNWEHKCSLRWLAERQRYLTATDIKSLLPVTKTGRKREVTDLDYIKVMSGKMRELTEEDCISYGAAARGHILEPYAIDALNQMLVEMQGEKSHETFFWWDDKLISMPDRQIAFSPDAMNVPMTDNFETPSAIAEVKSYGYEKHLVTAYTPKEQLEERWQIATSMALLEQIDHAYLVLFNPSMYRRTFVIRYDRSDLKHEIKIIRQIEDDWKDFAMTGVLTGPPISGAVWSNIGEDEASIIREIEKRQQLNPV